MKVGIPTEIKTQEFRAGITPAGVHALKQAGHEVLVQKGAGLGSMITDEEYRAAGARIVESAAEIWASDMVVKVKEPLPAEYEFFHKDLLLFTYLHLAPEPELTKKLLEKQVTGIAYETVQLDNGALPLLAPMSEVAGRMATQVGAQMLTKREGGMGLLMGGTAGVEAAEVVILGAGTVGLSAAKVAMGMGARVTMLDSNINRLRQLDDIYGQKLPDPVLQCLQHRSGSKKGRPADRFRPHSGRADSETGNGRYGKNHEKRFRNRGRGH